VKIKPYLGKSDGEMLLIKLLKTCIPWARLADAGLINTLLTV